MKIRIGFVSNSSSTSFVLAFKEPEKCKCCGQTPFDCFSDMESKAKGKEGYGWYIYNSENEITNMEHEISELKKDKTWLEGKIGEYEKIVKNPETDKIASYLIVVIEEQLEETRRIQNSLIFNRGKAIPNIKKSNNKKDDMLFASIGRQRSEYQASSKISQEIDRLKNVLRDIGMEMTAKTKYINSLKKFSGKEWKIFSLTVNHMDDLDSSIKSFIKSGKIQVIKQEPT